MSSCSLGVAAACEVAIAGRLVAVRRRLVAVRRGLVAVGRRLIDIRKGLIAILERLVVLERPEIGVVFPGCRPFAPLVEWTGRSPVGGPATRASRWLGDESQRAPSPSD